MINKDKILLTVIFVVLGFVALQIPINNLAGSNVKFTIFDLFAPVSGAFLGTEFGILAVFAMQIVNIAFHGFSGFETGTLIRLFPILFGVWFFAKREKNILIFPLVAIILFNLNPIGRSVWYYSLFWTIPFLVFPIVKKSLVARSLVTTFISHSVGGAIWIWSFHLSAAVWKGLIPVVALERSLMTLGMCATFLLLNNILVFARHRKLIKSGIIYDKQYLLGAIKG